ncbi:MAG: DUF2490 domain-containing protein [Firmicutes bacterium]|nr:DUF2490 domain-containing protein [Bacillota bacterium]
MFFLFLIFVISAVISTDTSPVSAKEWECYYSVDFYKKVNDKVTLKFDKELRFGDGRQFYQSADIGFSNSFNSKWEAGGGFRQGLTNSRKSQKRIDTPYVYGTYKWNAGSFKASTRLMYEQRYFSTGAQHGRMRLRLMFQHPFKNSGFCPYVSDEVYLQLGGDSGSHVNANTLSLGVKQKLFDGAELDLSYKKQNRDNRTKYGEFRTEYDVLSFKLRFDL